MASGKWQRYDYVAQYLEDGTIDFDTDALKVALFLVAGNANTLTLQKYGDVTQEHANGNGYLTGGVTVTGSVIKTGSKGAFDITDPSWTASGGNIVARFAVAYVNATKNGVVKPLIAFCLLDTTPADVTCLDGNTLLVTIAATGLLDMDGGQTQ